MFGILYFICAVTLASILKDLLPAYLIELYSAMGQMVLSLILINCLYPFFRSKIQKEIISHCNRAVFITGCDSGFGHKLAKMLDLKGFHVFAGCLFYDGEGAKDLKKSCSSHLRVLGLDVTNDESIAEAVRYVKKNMNTCELWAIVNNAGIQQGFDVEWSQMEQFQTSFNVNALGPVRVTKAFLPLLRSSRGRIINVASITGRIAVPHVTPYEMTKFATVAFSDCLRMELDPWGIKVISIEPETFKTGITNIQNVKKNLAETVKSLDEEIKMDYGDEYFRSFEKCLEMYLNLASDNTDVVITSIENALSLKQPENVYRPCRNFLSYLSIHVLLIMPLPIREAIIKFFYSMINFPSPREAETAF